MVSSSQKEKSHDSQARTVEAKLFSDAIGGELRMRTRPKLFEYSDALLQSDQVAGRGKTMSSIAKRAMSPMKMSLLVASSSVLLFCAARLSAQDGAALYKSICAGCHETGVERAPNAEALKAMSPEQVLAMMENGDMSTMASRLSGLQRRAIAEFVTGKHFGEPLQTDPSQQAMCADGHGEFVDPQSKPLWNGWGGLTNSRFQDASSAGLTTAELPRLKLKWAFGFPGDVNAAAQPTIISGRVFVGSQGSRVYSLDAATGCVRWWIATTSTVRAAISVGAVGAQSGRYAAFFGDLSSNVYAVDAATGTLLWKVKVDNHPAARITGSPTLYRDRLYVPVSSTEEGSGAASHYPCCTFRGSVVALDTGTGKQSWKTYTVSEQPHPTTKNKNGTQLWGPSGVAIWSSPTIDPKRNALYVATGDNYSDPPTNTSDAFLALDLDSGKMLWSRQITALDVYVAACRMADKTNCPKENGPDFDFGSSPILVNLANGSRALVAGQKSGVVHAIDPDRDGKILWQVRVGTGGVHGGIQWGAAADESNVYVALSDAGAIPASSGVGTEADPNHGGGMFALELATGGRLWAAPPPKCGERKRCSPAQSAAVMAIPGAAFSGSLDGHLRAYSVKDGAIIWDFDTVGPHKTVNGVDAHGGSIDAAGPAVAGGLVFVESGYSVWGGMSGNVLLAFSVDGK